MWSDLGLELGLKWDALEIIKKNNPKNVKDCLKEMLSMWLRTNPTLEDLAKALEQEHIALPDAARKVRQGFESTIGQLTFIPTYILCICTYLTSYILWFMYVHMNWFQGWHKSPLCIRHGVFWKPENAHNFPPLEVKFPVKILHTLVTDELGNTLIIMVSLAMITIR